MKRHRLSGEGSVFQRKDGRWCARPRGGTIAFYGHTAEEARSKRDAAIRRSPAILKRSARLTFGRAYAEWLDSKRFSPTSYQLWTILAGYLLPQLGSIPLYQVTAVMIYAAIDKARAVRTKAPLSSATRVLLVRLARSVVRYAAKHYGLPAVDLPLPRSQRSSGRPIPIAEIESLLVAAREHAGGRYEVAILLCLSLGLRRGECAALQWQDLDICTHVPRLSTKVYTNPCTVSITKSMNARREIQQLKTDRSRRVLRLPTLVVEALRRTPLAYNSTRDAYVIAYDNGSPTGPRAILRAFHRILELAGIERRRVHDLRHTCATLLLADGAPIQHVSDLLGHASIKTTKDVYGHVIPATFAAIAEQSDKIMRAAIEHKVN